MKFTFHNIDFSESENLEEALGKNLEPRIYHWNEQYEKWVALASYPQGDNSVMAINEGEYTGWFTVFAVQQPRFLDVNEGDWYESPLNRSNGMALLEGFPENFSNPESLNRLAKPHAEMSRAEYVAMVTRALGLVDREEQSMYDVLELVDEEDIDNVLSQYEDAGEIPDWARGVVATALKSGILDGIEGMEDDFSPYTPITRIEAAVIVSNALTEIPDFQYEQADLSGFQDADQVPEWASDKIVSGVLYGDNNGNLNPNAPVKRSEAFTIFLRVLGKMGW